LKKTVASLSKSPNFDLKYNGKVLSDSQYLNTIGYVEGTIIYVQEAPVNTPVTTEVVSNPNPFQTPDEVTTTNTPPVNNTP
jgi:hypothetical protein